MFREKESNARKQGALSQPGRRGPSSSSYHSPGHKAPATKWQSSYLDKPSGNPRGSTRSSTTALSSPFSPVQSPISKIPRKSARILYEPPLTAIPDTKIEVKIPNIDQKIRARKLKQVMQAKKEKEDMPEHIRRFREREERARLALEETDFRTKQSVETYFFAWKARAQYPRLRRENAKRFKKMARERAMKRLRFQSAINIQKTFRMYIPRKRYIFVIGCRRRRERNQREMKQIEKKLARMPKDTKAELKEMKKKYTDKKKVLKNLLRGEVKREDDLLEKLKEQGQEMIRYLQEENKRLKEKQEAIKHDQTMMENRFDELSVKSEEISRSFASLQQFVVQKNQAIQKHELSSQKCRHRYMPKYRKDLKERNVHCIAEFRVKTLYKTKIEMIMREIEEKATDSEVIKDSKRAFRACKKEIAAVPEVDVPTGLWEYFEED
jgi:hypothetical protein